MWVLFGGTFDPFHNGHAKVVQAIESDIGPKKIILIPNYVSPHKLSPRLPGNTRIDMLKRFAQNHPTVEVSSFEVSQPGSSYTENTVAHYLEKTQDTIGLAIGSDSCLALHTWHHIDRWIGKITLIIAPRTPNPKTEILAYFDRQFPDYPGKNLLFLSYDPVHVSSTDIRRRLDHKQSVADLVPPEIDAFLKETTLI